MELRVLILFNSALPRARPTSAGVAFDAHDPPGAPRRGKEKLPIPQKRSSTVSVGAGRSSSIALLDHRRVELGIDLHEIRRTKLELAGRTPAVGIASGAASPDNGGHGVRTARLQVNAHTMLALELRQPLEIVAAGDAARATRARSVLGDGNLDLRHALRDRERLHQRRQRIEQLPTGAAST